MKAQDFITSLSPGLRQNLRLLVLRILNKRPTRFDSNLRKENLK
jgi:hypothetical protein